MSKTILITGGAGFIAHHVIQKVLTETDWNVVSLDRLDFSGNLNRLHETVTSLDPKDQKRCKVVFHDLKADLNPQIRSAIGKVDYIAHLAAGSHVDRSIDNPLEFVMDNVVGTCNILNFARSVDNLKRFVYFSTDEVFGPAPVGTMFKEYDRYNSTNPYSASKAGGEELVVAFHNSYGLPAYITHTMNVFGERQHPEKYIPMCIRNVRDGKSITVHSSADKKTIGSRFYIHADDVADALLRLLQTSEYTLPTPEGGAIKCQKFNIVGMTEWNNLQLASKIAEIQGKPLHYELVDFHSSRPGHDLRYALDGTRMVDLIGWTPKSIEERLEQTVRWTLENDRWLKI